MSEIETPSCKHLTSVILELFSTVIKFSCFSFATAKYLSLASFMMLFYGIPISPQLKPALESCTPKFYTASKVKVVNG